jgi:hypothetical protein
MTDIILKYEAVLSRDKDTIFTVNLSHNDCPNPLDVFNTSVNTDLTDEINNLSQSLKKDKKSSDQS